MLDQKVSSLDTNDSLLSPLQMTHYSLLKVPSIAVIFTKYVCRSDFQNIKNITNLPGMNWCSLELPKRSSVQL